MEPRFFVKSSCDPFGTLRTELVLFATWALLYQIIILGQQLNDFSVLAEQGRGGYNGMDGGSIMMEESDRWPLCMNR